MQRAGRGDAAVRRRGHRAVRGKNKQSAEEEAPDAVYQMLQSTFKDWKTKLSPAQIQKLQSEHPALTSFDTYLLIIEVFQSAAKEQIKNSGHSEILSVFSTFISMLKDSIADQRKQRKEIGNIHGGKKMQDPKNIEHIHTAALYKNGILMAEDVFNRKKNFKQYAEKQLMEQQTAIEEQTRACSGIVSEQLVQKKFMVHYDNLKRKNNELLAQYKKTLDGEVALLFKEIDAGNKLAKEIQLSQRQDEIKQEIALKDAINEEMGACLGYSFTMRDYVTNSTRF